MQPKFGEANISANPAHYKIKGKIFSKMRTEHRAQFSRGRYRRSENMRIKILLYIYIYNKVIFTTFYCSSENCALCSVRTWTRSAKDGLSTKYDYFSFYAYLICVSQKKVVTLHCE